MVDCEGRGSEKSNRWFETSAVDGLVVGAVLDVKSKSSSPFDAFGVRIC